MKGQKILIGLVVILTLGLIFQGIYMAKLKKQVDSVAGSQATTASGMLAKKPSSTNILNKNQNKKFSSNWYLDDFFDQEWEPFEEMKRMQEQFNRIFNESFGRGIRSRGFMPAIKGSFFEPDIDIREEEDNYIVKIDLPGMEKDNINIEIKDNILTVSGERETVIEENKGDKFFRQERSYGHFSRSFPLPDDVKEDQITADYKNGVLTVKIARVPTVEEKEKESKKIKVF